MTRLATAVAFFALLISACGNSTADTAASNSARTAPVSFQNTTANAAANSNASTANPPRRGSTQAALAGQPTTLADAARSFADRKVIRNAELELETASPSDAQHAIEGIVQRRGGFVVEAQESSSDARSGPRDTVRMIIRVPADEFSNAVSDIRGTAERVITEAIKGEDVTEEFIDVEARLKAKKALEQQFAEIMKRAHSVEDALNVQSELADVRSEIERIEGRKRFLENQASVSTIRLKLQTPAAIANASQGFPGKLAEAFGTGLDFALNFILGLVTVLIAVMPFVLLIGIPSVLAGRAYLKRMRRRPTAADIAREEINAS